MSEVRPPVPPFTHETAVLKVRAAEDGWNSRNPEKVSLAYTLDSRWRNRNEIFSGRNAIVEFLTRKWEKNENIVSSRNYGHSANHASPCALRTNGKTRAAIGFALMVTKIGSSTKLASWLSAMPASTTSRSQRTHASSIGLSAPAARMIIRA